MKTLAFILIIAIILYLIAFTDMPSQYADVVLSALRFKMGV